MAYSAYDMIYAAFRIAGILRGPRRGLSNSEIGDGQDCLNSLLDSWNAERLNVYAIKDEIFNLVVNKQSYTIGIDPAGLLTADFVTDRPERIRNANIITNVGGGPQSTRVPMTLLNDDGWAGIRVRSTGSSIPQQLYDDYDSPLSTLNLWPFPNAAAQLELFSWKQLVQIVNPTDTISLPPAYRRALEFNLALELAPRWPSFPVHPQTVRSAMEAKASLQAINSPTPVMSCDPALLSAKKSTWNYLIGEAV